MATGSNSAGLLFKIKADESDAVRGLKNTGNEVTNLTGMSDSLKEGFAGAAVGIGTAAVAIGAVAVAAAAAVKALYDLTVQAAAYGSAIADVADKTGLAARTISGLKLAADQSGSSIDKVASATAKFNILLGQAEQGNKKAQAALEAYGITAKDAETALGQAFAAVNALTSAEEKAAAAATLFKDSTGEILPVIKTMNGDLEAAKKRAEELGVSFDEKTAAAADKLDDSMKELGIALTGVGLQIGTELIPHLQRLVTGLIDWIVRNQQLIRAIAELVGVWGERFVNMLLLIMRGLEWVGNAALQSKDYIFAFAGAISNSIPALQTWVRIVERIHQLAAQAVASPGGISGARVSAGAALLPAGGPGRARGGGGAGRASNDAAQRERADLQAAIQIERDKLRDAESAYERVLKKLREDFKNTGDSAGFIAKATSALTRFRTEVEAILPQLTALEEQASGNATANQAELLRRQQQQRVEDLQRSMNESVDRNNELRVESDQRAADLQAKTFLDLEKLVAESVERRNALWRQEETQRYQSAIQSATTDRERFEITSELVRFLSEQEEFAHQQRLQEINEQEQKRKAEIAKEIKDETGKQEALAQLELTYQDIRLAAYEEFKAKVDAIANKFPLPAIADEGLRPGTSLLDGIFGGLGVGSLVSIFDEVTGAMVTFQQRLQDIRSDINTFVGESIGGMINGLVQMGVAWLSTGEFSAKAALQMLASVAFSIATQAAIKAVFEAAEAVAAAARWDFVAASLHSTAASMYATVAVVAGAAGVGLALGARAMGGGGSKSFSSASRTASGQGEQNRNQSPISRQNDRTFESRRSGGGSIFQQATDRLTEVLDEFQQKVRAVKAGEVFIAGMRQNPGAVGSQAVRDVQRDASIGTNWRRATGLT